MTMTYSQPACSRPPRLSALARKVSSSVEASGSSAFLMVWARV